MGKMIKTYTATVFQDFIDRRQERIDEDDRTDVNPYFQWDAEFVEWHQSITDPMQAMYEGYEYDTTHEVYGNLDYKMYSKEGVKVSSYIQKQIADGKIKHLVVWKWTDGYKQLYLNQEIRYTILGIVSAEEALTKIVNGRFNFEEVTNV